MSLRGKKVLFIDDDEDVLFAGSLLLKAEKCIVETCTRPDRVKDIFKKDTYDLVMLDMNFRSAVNNGNEGMFILRELRDLNQEIPVIMITAYAEIEIAVQAIKNGAADFIAKPWRNEVFLEKVNAVLDEKSKQTTRPVINTGESLLIGNSPSFSAVIAASRKVASTDANILITGENGTGKDLLGKFIHDNSARKNHPFIKVDTGSIVPSLFESEMFGHKKGSFTDAREDREGKFKSADGGTLFLNEIGNLNIDLQAKLLTAIQQKNIVKVGSNKEIPVDVRIISATNAHLEQKVAQQTFRQDLLFRLNTVVLHMPALRERKDDIEMLAQHFLEVFAKKYNKEKKRISFSASKKLNAYHWPGNIRELEHAIERAVILNESDEITDDDFVFNEIPDIADRNEPLHLSEMEREAIKKSLMKHSGNISRVARELGLSRAALYRRIEKYGI